MVRRKKKDCAGGNRKESSSEVVSIEDKNGIILLGTNVTGRNELNKLRERRESIQRNINMIKEDVKEINRQKLLLYVPTNVNDEFHNKLM